MSEISSDLKKKIASSLLTKGRALRFKEFIDLKKKDVYRLDKRQEGKITALAADDFENLAKEIGFEKLEDSDSVEKASNIIGIFLAEVEPVILKIAFEPRFKFVKQLYNWFEENIKKAFLLDFTLDSSVVGGTEVVYKGKFYDLSLNTKLTRYFEEKRDEIRPILQK
ncbi:MAG: hypothetical protein PVJ52_03175 [Candidatus Woesebacteria bacterium]|jgi:hypothetical protein